MKKKLRTLTLLPILFLLPASVLATVTLNAPFTSHMVLQRNMKVSIWGSAAAGETVTVKFNGQQKTVVASAAKTWKLQLDPMVAGGPFTMTVSGTNTISLTDVYVGEVWQCAGQSNMDLTLNSTTWGGKFDADIAAANYPKLRYMKTRGGTPVWNVMSSATAGGCSATGYFFGKDLLQNLDCAVGLVVTAVGGTTIEQWFDPAAVTAFKGKTDNSITPGDMYAQFVKPVVNYGIKGTIWIQGEQNASKGFGTNDYGNRFKAVITGWRNAWGQGDFPFYFGQITGVNTTQTTPFPKSAAAEVREGQRQALELPETAMSVMLDISGGGWHYTNKQEAGRRLALAPKALLYGKKLEYAGPLWESASVTGNTATLHFTHSEGLKTNDNKAPSGFALAGNDGVWYAADKSAIAGNAVVISSTKVAKPVKVVYGWNDRPKLNLYNGDNLQASPFLTESLLITALQDENEPLFSNTAVSISPNPANGNQLRIELDEQENTEARIVLFSPAGESLLTQSNTSQNTPHQFLLDISGLPQGTYFLQIQTKTGSKTTTFIRQ